MERQKRHVPTKRAGFTLVELITVVFGTAFLILSYFIVAHFVIKFW